MDRASAIDEFLDSHPEADDRIVGYIRDTWSSLLDDYDYATIYNVENACTLQMISETEDKYKKAISKLTKQQIFEIASTGGLSCRYVRVLHQAERRKRIITRKSRPYTETEKALVEYLKAKLAQAGVTKFPQDWHLKQLTTARRMLAGEAAPALDEWQACIDWAFSNEFWKTKVDHLARILALWPKFKLLQKSEQPGKSRKYAERGSYGQGKYNSRPGQMPF